MGISNTTNKQPYNIVTLANETSPRWSLFVKEEGTTPEFIDLGYKSNLFKIFANYYHKKEKKE